MTDTSEEHDLHADLIRQFLRTILGLAGDNLPLTTHRFTAALDQGVVSGIITARVSENTVQITDDQGTPHDVHFSQFCGMARIPG